MAYYFSPFGNDQFVDANGNPLSGAQLFTYIATTTTKATVYKDSLGAASHTNPIILDSTGRSALPLWLIEGQAIKFVLAPVGDTDPPASPILTRDNIVGINDVDTGATLGEWVIGTTPTYINATQLSVAGDQTAIYHVGRRVKVSVSAGTRYGRITVSAFTTATTITLVMDSGALDNGLSSVSYGILSALNSSAPAKIDYEQTFTGNVRMGSSAMPAWGTAQEVQQFGSNCAIIGDGNNLTIVNNAYYNAAAEWRYVANGTAMMIRTVSTGEHEHWGAASGTAGNVISWSRQYRVNTNGVLIGSATGGAIASGAINAEAIWEQGTRAFSRNSATILNATLATVSSVTTVAHGLGARPTMVILKLECTSADNGFSVGDEIEYQNSDSPGNYATYVTNDATNIKILQYNAVRAMHKSTVGAFFSPAAAQWRWKLYVWA